MGGALEIEKGARWELRAEDLWPAANPGNLSRFLQLPSELCQKALMRMGVLVNGEELVS